MLIRCCLLVKDKFNELIFALARKSLDGPLTYQHLPCPQSKYSKQVLSWQLRKTQLFTVCSNEFFKTCPKPYVMMINEASVLLAIKAKLSSGCTSASFSKTQTQKCLHGIRLKLDPRTTWSELAVIMTKFQTDVLLVKKMYISYPSLRSRWHHQREVLLKRWTGCLKSWWLYGSSVPPGWRCVWIRIFSSFVFSHNQLYSDDCHCALRSSAPQG